MTKIREVPGLNPDISTLLKFTFYNINVALVLNLCEVQTQNYAKKLLNSSFLVLVYVAYSLELIIHSGNNYVIITSYKAKNKLRLPSFI